MPESLYTTRSAAFDDALAMAMSYNEACDRDPLEQICYPPGTVPGGGTGQRQAYFEQRLQETLQKQRSICIDGSNGAHLGSSFFLVAEDIRNAQVVGFTEWAWHAPSSMDQEAEASEGVKEQEDELCKAVVGNKAHYHLEALYILPAVEKQGVGKQLLEHGVRVADRLCVPVFLPVYLSRLPVAKSYFLSTFGFVDHTTTDRKVSAGCNGEEDYPLRVFESSGVTVSSQLVRHPMGVCTGVGDNQTVQ